ELRTAITEQTADAICLRVPRHHVPGAAELLRGRQTRGSRAYDSHLFTRPIPWRFRTNPAFFEAALDDALFNLLDRHRRLINPEDAGRFARRGTYPPGELGEISGGMQLPY